MPINIVGDNILQGTGYVALGYSQCVIAPVNFDSGIQNIVKGASLLISGVSLNGPNLVGGTLADVDYRQFLGLISRGLSKMLLTPADVQGGVKDILQALLAAGMTLKSDPADGHEDIAKIAKGLLGVKPLNDPWLNAIASVPVKINKGDVILIANQQLAIEQLGDGYVHMPIVPEPVFFDDQPSDYRKEYEEWRSTTAELMDELTRDPEEGRVALNLNLIAPINDLGYGCAGANILAALAESHEVSLFSIGAPSGRHTQAVVESVKAAIERAKSYDAEAPSIRIWHQNELSQHVGRGFKVGFPFFELDRLEPHEVYQINQLDLLLVASGWAWGVANSSGVKVPIGIVPLGVDRSVFHPKPMGLEGTQWAATTVFFNVGKWEVRKGHDVLIKAFNQAFNPEDEVFLRMCCHNPFIGDGNAAWEGRYLRTPMGEAGRIEILRDRLPDQSAVADFMNQGDVGVFPARAEGWNLDLLEAMACGKHVIVTDVTAHQDFCSPKNAHLVYADGLEPANDGVWFHGQGQWAKLDDLAVHQIAHHMRSLHELKQRNVDMVNYEGLRTAEKYSWQNSANALIYSLDMIRPKADLTPSE